MKHAYRIDYKEECSTRGFTFLSEHFTSKAKMETAFKNFKERKISVCSPSGCVATVAEMYIDGVRDRVCLLW